MVFDLRIQHRGTANTTPKPRSILYLSYVVDWYHDAVNFKTRQTVAYDALPNNVARRLLRRLDTLDYIAALERAVGDPAKVKALQAKETYKIAELTL